MEHNAGTATVIARPDLEPVGQCPYCHGDLMRKNVEHPVGLSRAPLDHPGIPRRPPLFSYWVCMNPYCALMFWRCPVPLNPRGVDDDFHH